MPSAEASQQAAADRRRLIEDMLEHGGVADDSGLATSMLADRVGMSIEAVRARLAQLQTAGVVRREVNGKRCYRIEVDEQAATRLLARMTAEAEEVSRARDTEGQNGNGAGIDYRQLATSLVEASLEGTADAARTEDMLAAAVDEVAYLRARCRRLEHQLEVARAELARVPA